MQIGGGYKHCYTDDSILIILQIPEIFLTVYFRSKLLFLRGQRPGVFLDYGSKNRKIIPFVNRSPFRASHTAWEQNPITSSPPLVIWHWLVLSRFSQLLPSGARGVMEREKRGKEKSCVKKLFFESKSFARSHFFDLTPYTPGRFITFRNLARNLDVFCRSKMWWPDFFELR